MSDALLLPAAAALGVHEILIAIFEYLLPFKRSLVAASRVSRFWTRYATPLLWRRVRSTDLKKRVAAPRRAHFAAMVHSLTFYLSSAGAEDADDDDDHDDADHHSDANNVVDDGEDDDDDGSVASDNGSANAGRRIISLGFPRLRHLTVIVRHSYSAVCDRTILRFLRQRCDSTRLARVDIGVVMYASACESISPDLLAHFAHSASLKSLTLSNVEVPRAAMPEIQERAAAATGVGRALSSNSSPIFSGLQHLGTGIAPAGVAALARLLPSTLTTLQLSICDGRSSTHRIIYLGSDGELRASEGFAAAAATPPNDATAAAIAARAPLLPNLRELELLYEVVAAGWAEDISQLCGLSQLEDLAIGWWDSENRWRCSSCDGYVGGGALNAAGFSTRHLARLVAGLPRLRRLALSVAGHGLDDDALQLVGRACRQLQHLELRGDYDLYGVCRAAAAHRDGYGRRCPLFPELESLLVTDILPPHDLDESDEPEESGEEEELFDVDENSSIGPSTNEQGSGSQTRDRQYRSHEELRRQAPKLRKLSFTDRA